jgi:hypothetical protein
MDDGVDPMLRDQRGHARMIAYIRNDKRNAFRQCPIETGREIVEHDDGLAGIDERMHHVTSDIAGAASDQDRHAAGPSSGSA